MAREHSPERVCVCYCLIIAVVLVIKMLNPLKKNVFSNSICNVFRFLRENYVGLEPQTPQG